MFAHVLGRHMARVFTAILQEFRRHTSADTMNSTATLNVYMQGPASRRCLWTDVGQEELQRVHNLPTDNFNCSCWTRAHLLTYIF